MTAKTNRTKLLSLGLTGAIALAIVAGSGFSDQVVARPTPDKTAAAAQAALAKGQVDKAISLAESVVAASPREPAYRALLAHAYLKAGRFASAATTFDDAMKLGDTSSRTALGLSLAYIGAGRNRDAVAILDDWRDAIPVADLGLALALAGEPTRGSAVLADALRGGENTPKLRQNLAYSYALDGRWREARIMMSQDVPADQMDARISEWAAQARPEDFQVRVAGLIKAPLRSDPGQPTRLALNASPAAEQLAVESAAVRDVPQVAAATPVQPVVELPAAEPAAALASYAPVGAKPVEPVAVAAAPVEAAPVAQPAASFVQNFVSIPVVQPLPVRQPRAAAPARVRVAAAPTHAGKPVAADTHRVQLASFFTEQGARRAWGIYTAKNPELRKYRMTITKAQVRGKTYYRVAAAGLNGSQGARSLCGTVKARGMACFAYATSTGVPGTRAANAPMLAQAKAAAPKPAAPKAGVAGPAMARKR
jgi:Flp pilus assembly protein TadD